MNKKDKQDNCQNQTNINWYPGHMAKTKRLILEKKNLIDIVFEVLDARIPFSSKIRDIDDYIKDIPRILILNKSDLCDLTETWKWQKYYEDKGYHVLLCNLFDSSSRQSIISKAIKCAESAMEKRAKKGIIKKEIRALVIGIPNVGKSTLINRLAGKKATVVGNTPGVTKHLNWIKTNSDILLLDSPGILWPKFENNEIALNLASTSAIKAEILPIDDVAVHILKKLSKFYPKILEEKYGISFLSDDMIESYDIIAEKRKMFVTGGEPDYDRINTMIINDMKNERIKGVTFDRYEEIIKKN